MVYVFEIEGSRKKTCTIDSVLLDVSENMVVNAFDEIESFSPAGIGFSVPGLDTVEKDSRKDMRIQGWEHL